MKIDDIKKEMLNFKDFYGQDLLDIDQIQIAENEEELKRIIEDHRSHMEAMLSDAHSHLDHFKRKIGLTL